MKSVNAILKKRMKVNRLFVGAKIVSVLKDSFLKESCLMIPYELFFEIKTTTTAWSPFFSGDHSLSAYFGNKSREFVDASAIESKIMCSVGINYHVQIPSMACKTCLVQKLYFL